MARRKAPPPGYTDRLKAVFATRLGHILLRVGGLALLVLVGGVVMRQARAQAYRMPEHRVTHATLAFDGLPAWADEKVLGELERTRFYRDFSVSVFDPDSEARVRGVVTRHPMVRTVKRVQVDYPNRAIVTPVLREPLARVAVRVRDARGREKRIERLLADDGALLPRFPYARALKRRRVPLPRVVGIHSLGSAGYGVVWEDRHAQVAEAVSAARIAQRLFRDTRGRVSVTTIDVSRFPARPGGRGDAELRLRAVVEPVRRGQDARKVWIEWGRSERDCRNTPEEDCYRTKLGRLQQMLTRRELPSTIYVRYPLGR